MEGLSKSFKGQRGHVTWADRIISCPEGVPEERGDEGVKENQAARETARKARGEERAQGKRGGPEATTAHLLNRADVKRDGTSTGIAGGGQTARRQTKGRGAASRMGRKGEKWESISSTCHKAPKRGRTRTRVPFRRLC